MISPLGFPAFKSAFVCLFCLTVVSLLVASFHRGTLYLWTDCVQERGAGGSLCLLFVGVGGKEREN